MSRDDRSESLWEYEARLERSSAGGAADVESAMELYRPFGPLIARLSAPDEIVEAANRYVDRFVTRAGDPLNEDGSGIVVGTFRVPPDGIVGPLHDWCARAIADYVRHADGPPGEVRFEAFWVVRQGEHTFSPVHFHSTDVAGVMYLKVPDVVAEGRAPGNYITARRGGAITFLAGGRQSLAKSYVSFTPRVGDVLVSPAWLLHAVEPFDGPGERRSLAFNAAVIKPSGP